MLLDYWRRQTGKEKLFLLIIAVLVIFGIVTYIKYEIASYRLIKTQKKELSILKDSLAITKQRLKDYVIDGRDLNAAAKIKTDKINTKLKNDTKKINNSLVSDTQLLELLTKYEDRVQN